MNSKSIVKYIESKIEESQVKAQAYVDSKVKFDRQDLEVIAAVVAAGTNLEFSLESLKECLIELEEYTTQSEPDTTDT